MQMKMSQVMLLNSLRGQIEGNQYSIKTSYKIAKLFDDIEEEVNFYTKKLKELITQYSQKDENGNPKFSEDGAQCLIQPEKMAECQEKLSELESIEVTLPDYKFDIEEFGELKLTTNEVRALMPLFGENK